MSPAKLRKGLGAPSLEKSGKFFAEMVHFLTRYHYLSSLYASHKIVPFGRVGTALLLREQFPPPVCNTFVTHSSRQRAVALQQ